MQYHLFIQFDKCTWTSGHLPVFLTFWKLKRYKPYLLVANLNDIIYSNMFYRHFWFLITKGQDICSLNMKLSPIWYNYTDKRKNDIQFLSTCTNTTSQFCRQGQSDTKRWTNRRTVGWTIIRNHFHARIQRIFQGGGGVEFARVSEAYCI